MILAVVLCFSRSDKRIKSSTKIPKVSPKPVFVDLEMETQSLVINGKVKLDLLQLSYFYTKKKAAHEGKLMVIKFGANMVSAVPTIGKDDFQNPQVKYFSEKNYVPSWKNHTFKGCRNPLLNLKTRTVCYSFSRQFVF